MEKLSDLKFSKVLSNLKNLKVISINETPNLTEECLEIEREKYNGRINIVRNFMEPSSEKDNGLRFDYRNVKTALKKAAKARKGKKKKWSLLFCLLNTLKFLLKYIIEWILYKIN